MTASPKLLSLGAAADRPLWVASGHPCCYSAVPLRWLLFDLQRPAARAPPVASFGTRYLYVTFPRTSTSRWAEKSIHDTESVWRRFRDELLPGIRGAEQAFLEKLSQHYALSFDVDDLHTPFTRPVLLLTGHQDGDVEYRDQSTGHEATLEARK